MFRLRIKESNIYKKFDKLNQNGNLACGGDGKPSRSCVKLVGSQGWVPSHLLYIRRRCNTSWITPNNEVLLIGGDHETKSTELVKSDGTTETGSLVLKYESRYGSDRYLFL